MFSSSSSLQTAAHPGRVDNTQPMGCSGHCAPCSSPGLPASGDSVHTGQKALTCLSLFVCCCCHCFQLSEHAAGNGTGSLQLLAVQAVQQVQAAQQGMQQQQQQQPLEQPVTDKLTDVGEAAGAGSSSSSSSGDASALGSGTQLPACAAAAAGVLMRAPIFSWQTC